jgi:cytochrome c
MRDELLWNKIFGGILATLLALFGLREISRMLFTHEPPAKPGYAIAVKEEAGAGGEQADVPPDWGTVLPTADVAAGEAVSSKCASCHNFASGGPNHTGPNLYGVIGRKPGTHPGFAYSQAMIDFGNKNGAWDYAHLYQFLAGPQGYISGTKMSFVGLKKREDRINMIAWLRQQSASPAPIPPPNPAAAAGAKAPPEAQGSAPAPNTSTGVPAATGANAPAPVNGKAPTSSLNTNPSGVTPATGAAQQPDQLRPTPPGGSPK